MATNGLLCDTVDPCLKTECATRVTRGPSGPRTCRTVTSRKLNGRVDLLFADGCSRRGQLQSTRLREQPGGAWRPTICSRWTILAQAGTATRWPDRLALPSPAG